MSPQKQPAKQYNKKKSLYHDGDIFHDCGDGDKENEDNRHVDNHGEFKRALGIAKLSTTPKPTKIPRPKLSALEKMIAR